MISSVILKEIFPNPLIATPPERKNVPRKRPGLVSIHQSETRLCPDRQSKPRFQPPTGHRPMRTPIRPPSASEPGKPANGRAAFKPHAALPNGRHIPRSSMAVA